MNPGLPHCRQTLYCLSHQGSLVFMCWVISQRKALQKNTQTTIQLHSSHMLVKLKILQARASILHEPWTSRCSSWFQKRQRNQRPNCQHPLDHRKSKRVPEKHLFLLYFDYDKGFDRVDHNILWKILKELGIPDHLTCLLRNLYADQEATVRTGHGTTLVQNWERSTLRLYIVPLLI